MNIIVVRYLYANLLGKRQIQDAILSGVGEFEYLTRKKRNGVDVLFTIHKYMNLRYSETQRMTVINYKGHFYFYLNSDACLRFTANVSNRTTPCRPIIPYR
jgi:hypothetical protein